MDQLQLDQPIKLNGDNETDSKKHSASLYTSLSRDNHMINVDDARAAYKKSRRKDLPLHYFSPNGNGDTSNMHSDSQSSSDLSIT